MTQTKTQQSNASTAGLTLRLGHEALSIRKRYETLSILNDFLIAIWFLLGSMLFLFPAWEKTAVWLFIVGSAQFLIRPSIRLAHQVHLRRIPESRWEL